MKKPTDLRVTTRRSIEVAVVCRPFTSGGVDNTTEGVMVNFSNQGSYIEARGKYNAGTILVVRTVGGMKAPPSTESGQPRSISLAEIKWLRKKDGKNGRCYGLGLRYLD
ncbi:uncharacterized protein Dvar_63550 [Desulfosarcina variabilis str. Montpellier]|uniref:hypothetical protein n=1 Tax=Desulfosarcina variabilis TaxID=2300 RepID=UPI003AFB1AE6